MGLATRTRYRMGGAFSVRDGEGLVRSLFAGDELPQDIASGLSAREIDSLRSTGMLREIGASPPPRPAPVRAAPPSPEATLQGIEWRAATVESGRILNGPRACDIAVLDRAPGDADVKRVADTSANDPLPILTYRSGDGWVAVVPFGRLASLLALVELSGRPR